MAVVLSQEPYKGETQFIGTFSPKYAGGGHVSGFIKAETESDGVAYAKTMLRNLPGWSGAFTIGETFYNEGC